MTPGEKIKAAAVNERPSSVSYKAGALLAIETTGPICSVALLTPGKNALYRESVEGHTHLTSLLPMVGDLLDEAGLKPGQIGRIAVSAGPGSFTGIRIGIATARALAQTLRVPIVKVPTLETFVYQGDEPKGDGSYGMPGPKGDGSFDRNNHGERAFVAACPIFDARRGQMYAGAYLLEEDGRIMTLVNGGAYDPEEFFAALGASLTALVSLARRASGPEARIRCKLLGDGLPVFGEGIEDFKRALAVPGIEVTAAPIIQNARATLAWAVDHGGPEEYETLEPIYYRKAEAQRRLDERANQGDGTFDRGAVRRATENDVYGISVIERLSFGEPWLEESIRGDLQLEYSEYVVCENEGFILGYAGLHRILDEGHITNIAVHPCARRRGIGSAVLTELMKRAEAAGATSFTLEVRDSDDAAARFYEKHGFVTEGLRKDYYPANGGSREDARLMWRRGAGDVS